MVCKVIRHFILRKDKIPEIASSKKIELKNICQGQFDCAKIKHTRTLIFKLMKGA